MNRKIFAVIAFLFGCATAQAAQSGCPQHHLEGEIPLVVNELLLPNAKELCYLEFSIVHSGLTKTPLWAGEKLTSTRLLAARNIDREDVFAAEPALPANERSELTDYARSGYDRGHVAPAADMSSTQAKAESFTLANIVPQTAASNRGIWSNVEWKARDLASAYGEAYIVSGPIFLSEDLTAIGNGVAVPTHMFKAIYLPAIQGAAAWVVDNNDDPKSSIVSISDLTELTGIDVFPTLEETIKTATIALPSP